jgi:hypothetical protein
MTTPTMTNKEDDELLAIEVRFKDHSNPCIHRMEAVEALIRQSQSTLLRRVGEEVLKDESLPNNPLGLPKVQYEKRVLRNMLRADQRKALQAIIKEIEAPNQSGEGEGR